MGRFKIRGQDTNLHNLDIVSYCLMTNHVHLIAIPKDKESLAKAIGKTHRLYTRKINFEQKVRGHLFQERFYSTPLDEVHLLHAIKYVEQNPVKACMVKHPWDYKYSSARYRLNLVEEDKLLGTFKVESGTFVISKATAHKCPRCWKYQAEAEDFRCQRCEAVVNA